MESRFESKTQQLIVRLSDAEGRGLLEGTSFSGVVELPYSGMTASPNVIVQPLSDVDPDSRQVEPKDRARVKKKLGGMTSRVSLMDSQTVIYVAESLTQNRAHVAAEEIGANDIAGNIKLRPSGGVRIEFEER